MLAFPEVEGRYLDTSTIAHKSVNLSYGGHDEQQLDVYYPDKSKRPYPTVVFFHGGGFFKGNKGRYQLLVALQALERGYAVVSVGYRLAPKSPLPAAYDDARLAMDWLFSHAPELGLDPSRLCTWGESAGAALAVTAGYTHPVRAVIDWYAPMDISSVTDAVFSEADDPGVSNAELVCGGNAKEVCTLTNLLRLVGPGIPPTLIEHGLDDEIVPWQESEGFRDALTPYLADEDLRLVLVEGAHHGVADFEDEQNLALVLDFIDAHVLS